MREDGKAVRLEFWVVEKDRESLQSSTSLPVLNRLPPPVLLTSRKAQDEEQFLPMDRNTTSVKLSNRNREEKSAGILGATEGAMVPRKSMTGTTLEDLGSIVGSCGAKVIKGQE